MSEDNLNKGFLRLSRHIFDGRYWEDSREFSKFEALLDLIKSAEYKKEGGVIKYNNIEVKLKRGQLFATLRYLQERWGWSSRGKVDKFLKALEKGNTLETEKKQFGNILTLVNYGVYNPLETGKKQKRNSLEANPIKEEIKEDNIDEIVNDIYNLYPTKCFINGRAITKGKKCKDKIKTLLKKSETKESLEAKIKWILKTRKRDGIFLSDFTTFLNNLPDLDFEPPKNKFESYMQELKEDEDKKVDTIQLYKDLEDKLITPEQFKEIKRVSDSNYIKFVNRA